MYKRQDQYFPPYYAVPIINQSALEEFPEVEAVINKLSPYLTDEVMQELNYQVDEEGKEPADVARNFLEEQGLI